MIITINYLYKQSVYNSNWLLLSVVWTVFQLYFTYLKYFRSLTRKCIPEGDCPFIIRTGQHIFMIRTPRHTTVIENRFWLFLNIFAKSKCT